MNISKFTKKLNKVTNHSYSIEEEVILIDGVYEGELEHDNITVNSVNVYTGSKLTGSKIETYILSTPSTTPWKKLIKIFASVSKVYISYETSGDTVEADDINNLQDSIINIQESINNLTPINLKSQIIWKVQSPGQEPIYSTPILKILSTGVKALIYTSWDWFIYCRNADTGELIWRYATGSNCYGRCQAEDVNGDGKIEVFGASHDGHIYCLDENGNELWSFQNLYGREGSGTVSSAGNYYLYDTTKNWYANSFIRGSQGLNASVHIISGTGNGQILEISGVESNRLWFYDDWTTIPDSTSQYKIVPKYESDIYYQHVGSLNEESDNWYLYTTGFDGQCVKLNAINGDLIWKFSTCENIEPFPYILDINKDGLLEVLISTLDKHVYCLNAENGSIVWQTDFTEGNDAFISVKDIDEDGILEVLISSRDNRVHILNGNTGEIKAYTRDTGGDIDCRPFVDDSLSKMFVVGSDSGYICAYDDSGEAIWGYRATNTINTSMIAGKIDNDIILIQGDQMGGLHFLSSEGNLVKLMFLRGGIEGTPVVENNDDNFILYITTIDGWVYAIKIIRN